MTIKKQPNISDNKKSLKSKKKDNLSNALRKNLLRRKQANNNDKS